MAVTHLEAQRQPGQGLDQHRAICGMSCTRGNLVDHPAATTCRLCLRKVKSDTKAAYKALLLSHAAEELDTFTPGPPVPVTRGAHILSLTELEILNQTEAASRPAFGSVRQALAAFVAYRDEGASLASSSAPSRFEGIPKGTKDGRVSNVERQVDRVVAVARAFEAAYPNGLHLDDLHLPQALCRDVLLWHHVGRPVYSSKHRDCVQRHTVSTEWIIAQVERRIGTRLTERQIGSIVRTGSRFVAAWLRATREMD